MNDSQLLPVRYSPSMSTNFSLFLPQDATSVDSILPVPTGNASTDHHACADDVQWLCAAERVGHSIVTPSIAAVGMLLNVFNLVVLMPRGRFPESSYTFLASLALADLLSLFFFGVNGIGRGQYPTDRGWRAFEVYVYFPCGFCATTASILLTVTVSVERFAFIYRPLSARVWCGQPIARRLSLAVFAVSILFNVPRFFVWKIGDDGRLSYTQFGLSTFYGWLSWVYLVVLSLCTALCLLILNILLIVGVRRAGARMHAMMHGGPTGTGKTDHDRDDVDGQAAASRCNSAGSGRQHQQRVGAQAHLTRTVIAVVVVFMVGEMPSAFTSRNMIVALVGQKDAGPAAAGAGPEVLRTVGYRVAVLVSTILVVAQHSANFVVYCVFNRRFCDFVRQQMFCAAAAPATGNGSGKGKGGAAVPLLPANQAAAAVVANGNENP